MPPRPRPRRVPVSTYRLQFRPGFGFAEAAALVPYLHALGMTDVYASPLLTPRPGSQHGYDVADPDRLNPELGDAAQFAGFTAFLAKHGMGLLLDIVPNHMAADASTPRWWDVLERGRASANAALFDIDWDAGNGRVILPVLGTSPDAAARDGHLRIHMATDGAVLHDHDRRFPTAPETWGDALRPWLGPLRNAGLTTEADELEAVAAACDSLASRGQDPARGSQSEAVDAVRLALRSWLDHHPVAAVLVSGPWPGSPDDLRSLLGRQHYRLAFWKEGLQQLNYRRFFDVSDLVSVAASEPAVFQATHALILRLVHAGQATGLRIDHIDGIRDPAAYLAMLNKEARSAETPGSPPYIVAEKILAEGEALPDDWPVAGTTGYDFLNALTRVFVDPSGWARLADHAAQHLGVTSTFADAAYDAKAQVLGSLFPAEVRALAARLHNIAQTAVSNPPSQDQLAAALTAVTAALPVYRTYIRDADIRPRDRAFIEQTLDDAVRRGHAGPALDALRSVLLLAPPVVTNDATRGRALDFILRWQQLTGPAMAKGVEDTALYRHIVLTALNEVGGVPEMADDPVEALHRLNAAAAKDHPWTLNATSTHDTKRSEDARARLAAISEFADQWTAALDRWRDLNRPWRSEVRGEPAPSPADEALIYQSLLAAWPLDAAEAPTLRPRLRAYAVKAAREARLRTSWLDPSAEYEAALEAFINGLLDPSRSAEFQREFIPLQRRAAFTGMLNSLAQVVLKVASPGVPDLYQGAEMWDFSLVDPDNRRAVDFARRRAALDQLPADGAAPSPDLRADLRNRWPDGRLKLWVTAACLRARRAHAALFLDGAYQPLHATGDRAAHLCAFARTLGDHAAVAIAPRLTSAIAAPPEFPLGEKWGQTTIPLPDASPGPWLNVFDGRTIPAEGAINAADALAHLPCALLIRAAPAARP